MMTWLQAASLGLGIIISLFTLNQIILKIASKKRNLQIHEIIQKAITPSIESLKEESRANDDKIYTFLRNLSEEISALKNKVDENEKDRLKLTILSFADRIRNNKKVTEIEYKNIFDCHDKYTKLHGNGYEKEAMAYISEKYKNFEKQSLADFQKQNAPLGELLNENKKQKKGKK